VPYTSTSLSKRTKQKIRGIALRHFHTRNFRTTHEHGHWWVIVETTDHPRTFSVVNAVPGIEGTGLDFEEV